MTFRDESRAIFFATSIRRSPRRSYESVVSEASYVRSGSGAGATAAAAGKIERILPPQAISSLYSRQRKRTRSSTRARRKLHDTGMSSTLRTERFTPLARAMLRSSSESDSRPEVMSTCCRNIESRSTSAVSCASMRDRRTESEGCAAAGVCPAADISEGWAKQNAGSTQR